jgi:hypothetical protein
MGINATPREDDVAAPNRTLTTRACRTRKDNFDRQPKHQPATSMAKFWKGGPAAKLQRAAKSEVFRLVCGGDGCCLDRVMLPLLNDDLVKIHNCITFWRKGWNTSSYHDECKINTLPKQKQDGLKKVQMGQAGK